MKKKKEKRKERTIYILFKQTQRRCVTILFTRERGERGRESSRDGEQRQPREKRPSGLGAPTFATSHCGTAGARIVS